jgi:hypothetical protein
MARAPRLRVSELHTVRPAMLDINQDYTLLEACAMLCCSRQTLYKMRNEGLIRIKKRGARARVSGRDILNANRAE